MIEKDCEISISRQCSLLNLNRSTYYAAREGDRKKDLGLMKLIDQIYIRWPFYGSRRIANELAKHGIIANRKRIQRLMRLMGIQGLAPGIMTSRPHPEHVKYPYLLGGLKIDTPNQVWCTDITYIPMKHGFMYLVAVMDWHSRCVLSWELSNSLDNGFCISALKRAIAEYGAPEIFNSDQGCQFTSLDFIEVLKNKGIRVSMDGKGRASDNIFIERLWRSLKYEDIYLKEYQDVPALREGLGQYFEFYNGIRGHASLGYSTPMEVYLGKAAA
ncbi:MAG: integrase [Lentisphaerae bacterium GWF2_49_21]|nr:MAG: integrase [Lentisphaerae bacterium GWF2_49_21]